MSGTQKPMSELKLILSGVSIAVLAILAMRTGFNGLKTNFKSGTLKTVAWESFARNPEPFMDQYIQIDSVLTHEHLLEIEVDKKNSHFELITALAGAHPGNLNIRFFAKSKNLEEHMVTKNLRGIVRNLEGELNKEEIEMMGSGDARVLPGAILVDTTDTPRKWYWNLLLLLGPLVFILSFAKALYNKATGKTQ
jgi:hypothetical protein